MKGLDIIQDEHQSLAAIIHAVRYMLKEIGAGRLQPDFALFRAMIHYLDAYPEQRHHPLEDAQVFTRLRQKTDEANTVLDRLEQEHQGGEARIKGLEVALHHFASDPRSGFDGFVTAFDQFAEFYRNHMLLEEREVLPLCRKYFSEDDWAAVAEAFKLNQDPFKGTTTPGTHEDFQRIFSRLVAAAPAPIGLGAGPYREE